MKKTMIMIKKINKKIKIIMKKIPKWNKKIII